jgi:CubicO group peptidase (beta-lactamase class C family)
MKKQLLIGIAAACLISVSAGAQSSASSGAEAYWPTDGWRVSDPAAQGVDGAAVDAALDSALKKKLPLHGVLVIRHGFIIKERYFSPYAVDTAHELYSCTKSFVSALTGIAVQKGYLSSLAAPVLGLFPDRKFVQVDDRKKAMTIENLLTMSSGLAWVEGDSTYGQMYRSSRDWVKFVLDIPMIADPGTEFLYSSGNSIVLGAIVQQESRKDLYDLAQAELFAPIGIRNPRWDRSPYGLPIGGWGLWLTPRDMARLGYLYLHDGAWNGKQVVPASWVHESTRVHIKATGGLSYGYQWWIDPSVPTFAAIGRYGQCIYVVPDRDLVVVFTGHIDSGDAESTLLKAIVAASAR